MLSPPCSDTTSWLKRVLGIPYIVVCTKILKTQNGLKKKRYKPSGKRSFSPYDQICDIEHWN